MKNLDSVFSFLSILCILTNFCACDRTAYSACLSYVNHVNYVYQECAKEKKYDPLQECQNASEQLGTCVELYDCLKDGYQCSIKDDVAIVLYTAENCTCE